MRHHRRDVEAAAREEEGEEAGEVKVLAQTVEVAARALERVARGDLELEAVDRGEAHVAPLAAVDVLKVLDARAAQHRVEAGEDVLRDVQRLRGLRDAAARHRPHLVPHVGVAVVEAHHQRPRQEALHHRAKHKLVRRREARHRAAALREDVLAEADDAHVAAEELEQVAQLVCLAEVVVLVHVERLQVLAAREDDRVVLVLGLALADHGVARQLDAVHLADHARRAVRAVGRRGRVGGRGDSVGRGRGCGLLVLREPRRLPRSGLCLLDLWRLRNRSVLCHQSQPY